MFIKYAERENQHRFHVDDNFCVTKVWFHLCDAHELKEMKDCVRKVSYWTNTLEEVHALH